VVRLPTDGKAGPKLYLPNGAFTFASRQAYGLAYECQREQSHERALRRAFKLRAKLGANGAIGDYIPKPKWMRWTTFERAMTKIEKMEKVVDAHMALLDDRVKQLGLDI
jgi:hypothetical protein